MLVRIEADREAVNSSLEIDLLDKAKNSLEFETEAKQVDAPSRMVEVEGYRLRAFEHRDNSSMSIGYRTNAHFHYSLMVFSHIFSWIFCLV